MIMPRFRPLILSWAAVGCILVHGVVLAEETKTCGWHSDPALWRTNDFGDGVIRRPTNSEAGFAEVENFHDRVAAVAVDEHGSVIIAGRSNGKPAFARLLPDGNLDPAFGSNGRAVWHPRFPSRTSSDAAILPLADGYLLAAEVECYSGSDVLLRKVDRHGKRDDSFGSGGALTLRQNLLVEDVSFDRAGRMVILLGSDDESIVLAHFVVDRGVADSTFADKGQLLLPAPGRPLVRDIRISADDEILVVGWRESREEQPGASSRVTSFVIRLRPDGSPVERFRVAGSPPLLTEEGRWNAASVTARKEGDLTVVFDGDGVMLTSISRSGEPGQPMSIASAASVIWSSEHCKATIVRGAAYGSDGFLTAYGDCIHELSLDPHTSMLIVRFVPRASRTSNRSSAWISDFDSAFPSSQCETSNAPLFCGRLKLNSASVNAATIAKDGTALVVGRASLALSTNMIDYRYWPSDFAVVTALPTSCGFN